MEVLGLLERMRSLSLCFYLQVMLAVQAHIKVCMKWYCGWWTSRYRWVAGDPPIPTPHQSPSRPTFTQIDQK